MKRNAFDLGHQVHMTGQIGRLQTLSVLPVSAGDSIQANLKGLFRLAPLRRQITMDAKVDLFAFFVPHRHIYGEQWVNFIKEGVDENITFAHGQTSTFNGGLQYLGANDQVHAEIPAWRLNGYNRIWNRYFRVPSDDAQTISDGIPADGTVDGLKYGKKVAWLKTLWSTGIDSNMEDADHRVNISEVSGTDYFDILDLGKVKARYKTELKRDFFARRYNDVMKEVWGTGVNIDADERPELCMKQSFWMSGYDIDGQGDANLGQFSGKVASTGGMNMNRKYFNEHGAVWFMAVIRFPTLNVDEQDYLNHKVNPSYKEIAGDHQVIGAEPPVILNGDDYFVGTSAGNDLGTIPYGQWYRHKANRVHTDFRELEGYAFIPSAPTDKQAARYVESSYYDSVFQTDQLAHWNASINVNILKMSAVPTAGSNIFAGV